MTTLDFVVNIGMDREEAGIFKSKIEELVPKRKKVSKVRERSAARR